VHAIVFRPRSKGYRGLELAMGAIGGQARSSSAAIHRCRRPGSAGADAAVEAWVRDRPEVYSTRLALLHCCCNRPQRSMLQLSSTAVRNHGR